MIDRLKEIINSDISLLNENIILEIDNIFNNILDVDIEIINSIKNKIQLEAINSIKGIRNSYLTMATGSGKSKIAIDACVIQKNFNKNSKILLVVPTQELRDNNWKKEFKKWKQTRLYNSNIIKICYASLNKIKADDYYDLIIFDEFHNITDNNSTFLENNNYGKCLGLTATPPKEKDKIDIIKNYEFINTYNLTIDNAVKLRLIAPFKIKVIYTHLDNTDKYIKGGNKDKVFYTTEYRNYVYLNNYTEALIENGDARAEMYKMKRMRFIYNLKSKLNHAKYIISLMPKTSKKLYFCGTINQSIEISPYRYFSKPTLPKNYDSEQLLNYENQLKNYNGVEDLRKFEINKIPELSCVNALDEGKNISDLDIGFIIQNNNKERKLIQRLGRLLRFRINYEALIIILAVKDTVDEYYVRNSLKDIDSKKVEYIDIEQLKNNEIKIEW